MDNAISDIAILIIGLLVGFFANYRYACGERELRKAQENINKNILKDLEFYKKLNDQYRLK